MTESELKKLKYGEKYMENNRKYELSITNIFCCLAVIFIHVNSEAVSLLRRDSVQYAAVYVLWQAASFAVYGFVFLSGLKQFLSIEKNGFNAKEFYKKRVLSIVVPYILWVAVYYAYGCMFEELSFSFGKLWYYIYSGEAWGHFYFVIFIVQFYALMPLWVWLFKRVHPAFMLTAAFLIMLVFGQNYVNVVRLFVSSYEFGFSDRIFTTYFFWWTAGAYVGMNYEKTVEIFRRNRRFIYVLFALCAVFCLSSALASSVFERYSPCIESIMMMYRVAAVMFVFALSLTKIKSLCRFKFFSLIDKSGYIIYLSHCLVLKITNMLLDNGGVWRIGKRYTVRFLAVYIVSIGVCMAYTVLKIRLKQRSQRHDKLTE